MMYSSIKFAMHPEKLPTAQLFGSVSYQTLGVAASGELTRVPEIH